MYLLSNFIIHCQHGIFHLLLWTCSKHFSFGEEYFYLSFVWIISRGKNTLLFNIYTLRNTHSLDSKLECPLHHQQARQKDLADHVLPLLHSLQSRLWSHLLRLSPDQAGLGSDGQDDHRCRLLRVSAVRE